MKSLFSYLRDRRENVEQKSLEAETTTTEESLRPAAKERFLALLFERASDQSAPAIWYPNEILVVIENDAEMQPYLLATSNLWFSQTPLYKELHREGCIVIRHDRLGNSTISLSASEIEKQKEIWERQKQKLIEEKEKEKPKARERLLEIIKNCCQTGYIETNKIYSVANDDAEMQKYFHIELKIDPNIIKYDLIADLINDLKQQGTIKVARGFIGLN